MADKFYAKGPGNNGYIKNLEVLDFNPWNGKSGVFQMQVYKTAEGKYYLYGSCFGGTQNGVLIADITDPEHTRFVKHLQLLDPEEYPTTSTPKIQVADDLLICAMTAGSGPGALVEQSELMNMKCQAGIQIWSLKEDPENPKYLRILGLRSTSLHRCSSFHVQRRSLRISFLRIRAFRRYDHAYR